MNKRTLPTFILILLVGFGLWALLHKKPEPRSAPAIAEPPSQQKDTAAPSSHHAPSPVVSTPKAPRASVSESAQVPEDVMRYIQNVNADHQYDWKQPINFYGRVVDERDKPLAGAIAHFSWTDLSDNGTSEADAESSSDGLFSLLNRTGKRLSVTVGKQDYYTPRSENLLSFEYANPGDGLFTPDAANPIIFHLRKKGSGETLIHGSKLFGSRVEGTLSYVDLVEAKNKLTPPGDLTVRCIRSEPNAEKKFDWTFTLGVPEGGLIESTNEFDFVAPESGYQPMYQFSQKASDQDWTGRGKRKFFIKSLGGQHYARIEITIIPDYNQSAAYDVEWFLNPTGSRNLEPTEAKPQGAALPPGVTERIPPFK